MESKNAEMKQKHPECRYCHSKEKREYTMFEIPAEKPFHVCDDCMKKIYNTIMNENRFFDPEEMSWTPIRIKEQLDLHIIGQEKAKKILSVAVYNHYKRVFHNSSLQKSNILLSGPSGSGKTLLARTLADIIDVPFVIADATTYTQKGYVGNDVESCIYSLFQEAGYDPVRTEKGIVYIDEIDKLSKKGTASSNERDPAGEGVQNALLKLVEGTVIDIPVQNKKNPEETSTVKINTENILFIFGGAFSGIRKQDAEKVVGFNRPINHSMESARLASVDYIRYGMTPELMGRIPVIAQLEDLSKKELVRVLTEPEQSLVSQYKELFFLDGIELEFEPEALEKIAEMSMEKNLGARGLRSILEDLMLDLMFYLPSEEKVVGCIITEKTVMTHRAVLLYPE